jgi:hypothetical protein
MCNALPVYEFDAERVSRILTARLGAVCADHLPAVTQVDIVPPSEDEFGTSLNSGGLLSLSPGQITIEPSEGLQPLVLKVPMPYHGVFVFQNEGDEAAGEEPWNTLWTWCPWLTEAAGMRLVRGQTHREQLSARVGSGGGMYVDLPVTDEQGCPLTEQQFIKRFSPPWGTFLIQCPERLPVDFLQLILQVTNSLAIPQASACWLGVWREYVLPGVGNLPCTDLDDLNHRMLMSYPLWLASRLIASVFDQAVRPGGSRNATPQERWEGLLRGTRAIEASVAIASRTLRRWVRQRGVLHAFRPTNAIDAISQLTQLRRYDVPHRTIENMPAVYHQNHPSFEGRVCPVETPESEALGVSLRLAKGATLDDCGVIQQSPAGSHGLGHAASLIPFFEHNDGARNMMGAKNLKQALPVKGRRAPAVATAEEDAVSGELSALSRHGLIPDSTDANGHMAPGVDLLVAYMPYHGLNFEDAIVANERLTNEGLLDFEREVAFSVRIPPGLEAASATEGSLLVDENHLDDSGLAKVGTRLRRGTLLARLWHAKSGLPRDVRYEDIEFGELVAVELDYDIYFGGSLTCQVLKQYPLCVGDKLMGRHGNKGVIAALLPPDKMPRLPESADIPPGLRGRAVDLVLNPHGVISRMNVGQLMETHLGWLLNALPAGDMAVGQINCGAFAGDFAAHQDQVAAALKRSGLDECGRVQVLLPGNGRTDMPVVVGFQHIVRLRHIPALKSQSRGRRLEARYDIRTGQAVHGRRLGGGQRVGEMEFWALAAHQADSIIQEMLRTKADFHTFFARAKDANSTTWQSIRDHLFAMGIEVVRTNSQVRFDWALGKPSSWSAGRIAGHEDMRTGLASAFRCERCGYTPVERPVFYGENEQHVLLEEVLRELGLGCPDRPKTWSEVGADSKGFPRFEGLWELPRLQGRGSLRGRVECIARRTDVGITMTIEPIGRRPGAALTARGRGPGSVKGAERQTGRGFTAESIGGLVTVPTLLPIGKLHVSCSAGHPSIELRPTQGKSRVTVKSIDGGIFCPQVFGENARSTRSVPESNWGHIQLPEPIPYPRDAFMTDKQRRAYEKSGATPKGFPPPEAFPALTWIPILPLRYRSPQGRALKKQDIPEINGRYRALLTACDELADLESAPGDREDERSAIRTRIRRMVSTLFRDCMGVLAGHIPKEGLLRRHGLGRRVDCSGRLVITPDPELPPWQVKIPVHILWEVMGTEVADWLGEAETFFAEGQSGRLLIGKALADAEGRDATPSPDGASLYERQFRIVQKELLDCHTAEELRSKSIVSGEVEELCLRTLDGYLREHPDKLVILNRQPSLHKYSMLSFHPVPTAMADGEVMRISPLVCGPLGADFDGDEMALHWPLSDTAQQEAQRLLFRHNLLSEGSGRPLAHYAQDIVLGVYLLKRHGREEELYGLLPDRNGARCCRGHLDGHAEWNEKVGMALLEHICLAHPNEAEKVIWAISRLAFRSATDAGVSFGYFDLLGSRPSESALAQVFEAKARLLDACANDRLAVGKALESATTALGEATLHRLDEVLAAESERLHLPGLSVAAMAVSGARGTSQSKQLVAARGLLAPGTIGFDARPGSFFHDHSLVAGCDRGTYFWTVYNSRSSMADKKLGTGKAGYLTRELVGAMWGTVVSEPDCGATGERNPITCRSTTGVCQRCYGPPVDPNQTYVDPANSLYCIGYPAGLVAAQSIGERGTQLSMQSFHTGARAFTPDSVHAILSDRALFDFSALISRLPKCPDGMDTSVYEVGLGKLYAVLPTPGPAEIETAINRVSHEMLRTSTAQNLDKQCRANQKRLRRHVESLTNAPAAHQALASGDQMAVRAAADAIRVFLATPSFEDASTTTTLNTTVGELFVALLHSVGAYRGLLPRHTQLLWRTVHLSPDHTLGSTSQELPALAALGFCPIRPSILRNVVEKRVDPLMHPASRIMMGHFLSEEE